MLSLRRHWFVDQGLGNACQAASWASLVRQTDDLGHLQAALSSSLGASRESGSSIVPHRRQAISLPSCAVPHGRNVRPKAPTGPQSAQACISRAPASLCGAVIYSTVFKAMYTAILRAAQFERLAREPRRPTATRARMWIPPDPPMGGIRADYIGGFVVCAPF